MSSWRRIDQSYKGSDLLIASGLAGALSDHVSIIVAGTLSGVKRGALFTPMIAGASWIRSSLISKVITEISYIEVRVESYYAT